MREKEKEGKRTEVQAQAAMWTLITSSLMLGDRFTGAEDPASSPVDARAAGKQET